MKHINVEEVGAADPQRKTSPVLEDVDEEFEPVVSELDDRVCYFNDKQYPVGAYVSSGSTLLHCEKGGVWANAGSSYDKR